MLANSLTVSSLCVHNYVVPSASLIIIRAVNVLRVLNNAVASTGVPHR